jgi:hypothetical protein
LAITEIVAAHPTPCLLVERLNIIYSDGIAGSDGGAVVVLLGRVAETSAICKWLRTEIRQVTCGTADVLARSQSVTKFVSWVELREFCATDTASGGQSSTGVARDYLNSATSVSCDEVWRG